MTETGTGWPSTLTTRVEALLDELGIASAHIGTSAPMELGHFMSASPETVSSLALLNASRLPVEELTAMADRAIVFSGDSGVGADALARARPCLGGAEIHEFADYPAVIWADMTSDHRDAIADAMLGFLARQEGERPASRLSMAGRKGEAAGITYDVVGEGPALLLFPAMLAPSQRTPLLDRLAENYAVVRLGGPHLGIVAVLEDRGADESYRRVLRGMLRDARVGPSDRLLEIGCGSGAVSRWLARERLCALPIVGLDLNPFLIEEARTLAERGGVADSIEFREGNAETLPFGDASFDVALAATVIEECDAENAIREMVRVVRPGGRVIVKVRACDMHVFWSLPLDPEIKEKAEQPIRQVAPTGCADASLMQHATAL